jgi:ABC-2 type transport system permease protein
LRAFGASLQYEFRMQIRKRTVWIVPALSVLLFLLIGGSLLRDLFDPAERPAEARTAVLGLALQVHGLLTIGFGCLVADRLVRDDRLRVAPILDATPAPPGARLLGKYLGTSAATAIPMLIVYLGFAAAYAVDTGRPVALAWALAACAVVFVPGLLFVAAFAMALPLVMPAPLFRVLFVGYWLWNILPAEVVPGPSGTLLTPSGEVARTGLFGIGGTFTALNRQVASRADAVASIGLVVGIAVLVLAALAARETRLRTAR